MKFSFSYKRNLTSLLKDKQVSNEQVEVKTLIKAYDEAELELNRLRLSDSPNKRDERFERRWMRRAHRINRKQRRMETLGYDGSLSGRKELAWKNKINKREEHRKRRELRWTHRQLRKFRGKEIEATRKEMIEIKARILILIRGDPNFFKD